jgi:hypothetical protein
VGGHKASENVGAIGPSQSLKPGYDHKDFVVLMHEGDQEIRVFFGGGGVIDGNYRMC